MEIVAQFSPRSVFLSGESVKCWLQFASTENQGGEAPQCLAWASVQIQCECIRGPGTSLSPREDHIRTVATSSKGAAGGTVTATSSSSSSSFSHSQQPQSTSLHPLDWLEGAQGMSSSPELLFCELMLSKHETKTFEYSELLPFDAPPSYRGKNIRFRYNLLVATQRVGASVEVFKVPFRVISATPLTVEAAALAEEVGGKNSPTADVAGPQNRAARLFIENGENNDQQEVSVRSPFTKSDTDEEDDESSSNEVLGGNPVQFEVVPALAIRRHQRQLLHEQHRRRRRHASHSIDSPLNFEIANSRGKIARLCFFKRDYKLGETIIASFDFSDATVECLQYSACLVCTEEILGDGKFKKSQIRHSKSTDVCLGMAQSSMTLEVPFHIAPTFVSSGQCKVTWCIQFEFVVTNDRIFNKNEDDLRTMTAFSEDGEEIAQEWNGPRQVGVQTLVWNLPIDVFPCDPCHVELSVKNRSQFRFPLQKPPASADNTSGQGQNAGGAVLGKTFATA